MAGNTTQDRHRAPSFGEAFWFWLKLGFVSFGGPTGQIAMMHTELVEKKRWIDNARFLHALNFCMLLPGPEAQQLAIYIGWLLHKTRGGVIAGALFVVPSIFILWALSYVYVAFGNIPWIAAIFYGLKPAVLAIVAAAVIRIGSKALKNAVMWSLALAAFVAIYFFRVPFPFIIISAGILGLIGSKILPQYFRGEIAHPVDVDLAGKITDRAKPSWLHALKISATWIVIWALPLALAGIFLGAQHTIFREGIFFSKAAVVTFGGAYAVLPYVSQQAVEHYHWLRPDQMLDGLGLAETTPGPLILVNQYVGFIAGWQAQGGGLWLATMSAAMASWCTFAPSYLWIFAGAPFAETLRRNRLASAALASITAAVLGVIANLAFWFALHVVFTRSTSIPTAWGHTLLVPSIASFDLTEALIALAAGIALVRFKANVALVVLACAIVGLLARTMLSMR